MRKRAYLLNVVVTVHGRVDDLAPGEVRSLAREVADSLSDSSSSESDSDRKRDDPARHMSIVLGPNGAREIPEGDGLSVGNEESLSRDGHVASLDELLVGVELVEAVATGEEGGVGLGGVLEGRVDRLLELEEGRRAVGRGREETARDVLVDGGDSGVERLAGHLLVEALGGDEVGVHDVVDVGPVEEVGVVADLEVGLARLEDVEDSRESLTVARSVTERSAEVGHGLEMHAHPKIPAGRRATVKSPPLPLEERTMVSALAWRGDRVLHVS